MVRRLSRPPRARPTRPNCNDARHLNFNTQRVHHVRLLCVHFSCVSIFQGRTKCRKTSDADDCPQKERDGEMRSQLAMHDTAGMTLGAQDCPHGFFHCKL